MGLELTTSLFLHEYSMNIQLVWINGYVFDYELRSCGIKCYLSHFPGGNHMFKVNNKNTGTRYEICSKVTIKVSASAGPMALFWCLYC